MLNSPYGVLSEWGVYEQVGLPGLWTSIQRLLAAGDTLRTPLADDR
jgi:hypothetical protein